MLLWSVSITPKKTEARQYWEAYCNAAEPVERAIGFESGGGIGAMRDRAFGESRDRELLDEEPDLINRRADKLDSNQIESTQPI